MIAKVPPVHRRPGDRETACNRRLTFASFKAPIGAGIWGGIMELSHRITGISEDVNAGWEVFMRSRQLIAEGHDILELTIGDHDIRTDPSILRRMYDAAVGGHTGYAAIPGTPGLRATVAARVQERTGVPTTSDNILITPGGQSALFGAHVAVCDPGDTALYCDPYYATYPGTLRSAGTHPIAIAAHARDMFQPRAAAIAAHAAGAKSLLINSPNNPTGVIYSRETLAGIADACTRHDLWLISDEVYDTQVWDGHHISPRSLPGMADRTLVVGSMSKSHAMTGSRCGWLVAPAPVVEYLTTLAIHTTYGVAGFVQDAAQFALAQGRPLEDKISAPFRRRRDIATRLLAEQNVLRLLPSMGAMYLLLDVRSTGLSGNEFADKLLMHHHISVMPGESFGASAAGHIRLAMTLEDTMLETAITRLIGFAHQVARAR